MIPQTRKINLADAVFGGVIFLLAPIGLFAPKATVLLLIVAALNWFIGGEFSGSKLSSIPRLPFAGLAVLLVWSLLSSFWSVDMMLSLKLIAPLAALLAIGLFAMSFQPQDQIQIQNFLMAGFILAIALLIFEASTGNWLTRTGRSLQWVEIYDGYSSGYNVDAILKNGVVILTLLIWPTVGILWRRKMLLIPISLLIALLLLAVNYNAKTSILALFTGIISITAAHFSNRFTARILAIAFVIGMMATPFLTGLFLTSSDNQKILRYAKSINLPSSAVNRLITWKFVVKNIGEKPVLGWGGNSSKSIPGGNDKYILRDMSTDGKGAIVFKDFYLPLHPHNSPLQIWLELGGVGAIIVALFGGILLWRIGGNTGPENPWLIGTTVAILMFSLLSFGVWQNWWIAAQFLTLISIFAAMKERRN